MQSGTLQDTPYSFKARFGDGKGTNPEECAAATRAVESLARTRVLHDGAVVHAQQRGLHRDGIETEARLTMDPVDGKPTITAIHLLVARAGARTSRAAQFAEIASTAKVNCVVSRALSPGSR